MLSDYVGEEKFLKGVSIYLKKHLFANSVTRDLWEGIQEASGMHKPLLHRVRMLKKTAAVRHRRPKNDGPLDQEGWPAPSREPVGSLEADDLRRLATPSSR